MKIAFCTDIYSPQLSGVSDSIELLTGGLRESGHSVRIYAPQAPKAIPNQDVVRLPAWEIPGSGGAMSLVFPIGMMKDLKKFSPDIIHIQTFSTIGLAGVYAGFRLKIPLVGTDHTFPADYMYYLGLDYKLLKNIIRKFVSRFYNRCREVTAPSKSLIEELRLYGLNVPTSVISNIISTDLFQKKPQKELLKKKFGIAGKSVLVFGRIAKEKNLDFALDVFSIAAKEEDMTLVFIGDGPYLERLRLKAKSAGIKCLFLGTMRGAELVEAINSCDLYLITSTSDTQSMATLQAMACELPVIGARAGGLPEYIDNGLTGFVIDPSDTRGFAEKILEVIRDEKMGREFGAAGRKRALEFSPSAIVGKFEEIYARILNYED